MAQRKAKTAIVAPASTAPSAATLAPAPHFERYVDKIRLTRPYGQELLDQVKPLNGDRAIVSFSGGKDSVATSIYLMRHYKEVVPFFMYIMPGMSFVEETMDYYERHLFKRKIRQVPHPGFLRWVANFLYADPTQAAVVAACDWPANLKILQIETFLRESENLPNTTLVATGVRADDSPVRMMSIKRHGPVTLAKKKWHPIWDWTKREVLDCIDKAGLKLSAEYDWMPRSFSGIHAGYLLPIKKHSPQDYMKILEWMPLIEAEVWRYERAGLVR